VASVLVGVIAFPIGFFYGAIATAVAFGVARLWGFVTGKREREQRRSSRSERRGCLRKLSLIGLMGLRGVAGVERVVGG
jgi:hypothetical protein